MTESQVAAAWAVFALAVVIGYAAAAVEAFSEKKGVAVAMFVATGALLAMIIARIVPEMWR